VHTVAPIGAKPAYVGITYLETCLFHSDTRHKASAEAVGGGALLALHTYVALYKPQDWIAGINFSDPATVSAYVARGVRRLRPGADRAHHHPAV